MVKNWLQSLFLHLALILVAFMALAYVFFYWWLPSTTKHGEVIPVPELKGLSYQEAEAMLKASKLRIKLFDSTYQSNFAPQSIVNQFPKTGEKVKSERTIYVTINTVAVPSVKMPKLVGSSQKAAEMTLKSYGLQVGNISYTYSPNQGEVLRQTVNGIDIAPGASVKKNTAVDLLVSLGKSNATVAIPNVVGISLSEAKTLINTWGLEIGSIVYEEGSSHTDGIIIRQKPQNPKSDSTLKIRVGEEIDLWVAGKKPQ